MKEWTLTYKSVSIENVGGFCKIRKTEKSLNYRVNVESVENVKNSIIDRIKFIIYKILFIEIGNWLIELMTLIAVCF